MKKIVKVTNQKGLMVSLEIKVDKETYRLTHRTYLNNYIQNSNISGFRKGKAPENVILAKYGKNIHSDVLGKLINSSLSEALLENNLSPASPHKLDIQNEGSLDTDLHFNVNFEVYPEIKMMEMSKLLIEDPEVDITDTDINDVISNIRKQNTKWEEKKGKISSKDKVIIDYLAFLDNEENKDLSRNNFTLVIDDLIQGDEATVNLFNEFYKTTKGREMGDSISFTYKMPKTFPNKGVADKDIRYEVKIKNVFTGIIPDLNAEFYKTLGLENSTDEQFKQSVSNQMKIEIERRSKSNMVASINEQLLKNMNFDIPQHMLDLENAGIEKQYKGMMKNVDDKTKVELESIALKRVKLNLIYRKIAESNNISASDDDVLQYISKSDEPNKKDILSRINEDNKMADQIKHKIIEDGIIEHVLTNCKRTKVKKNFNEIVN